MFFRCGRRDRRSSVVIDEFARKAGGDDESSTRRGGAWSPLRGPRHREQLLAELPVKEKQLELAGVSSAVLEGGTDRRCFCCMAQESSRPCGHG